MTCAIFYNWLIIPTIIIDGTMCYLLNLYAIPVCLCYFEQITFFLLQEYEEVYRCWMITFSVCLLDLWYIWSRGLLDSPFYSLPKMYERGEIDYLPTIPRPLFPWIGFLVFLSIFNCTKWHIIDCVMFALMNSLVF